MKYNILIKYVNSIPSATKENRIDTARIRLLCEKIGRVNVGAGYIYASGGEYAHGVGTILESVLCSAGYSVGRITDVYNFDIKRSVFIDGASPSIEEYTNILTYIRDILKKNKEIPFLREEVVFAFCLYVCKTIGVKYVILENTREYATVTFESCAPYNFAVIPKLYGDVREDELKLVSECIDKVNRGVVTGNNHLYNYFSGRCHKAGIRLSIHRSVDLIEEKIRQQIFVYNKREYVLKSSSDVLRDAAISTLELVDMMNKHGAKIPPSAILEGVKFAGNCSCMDVVSISPMIICNMLGTVGEVMELHRQIEDYRSKNRYSKILLCIDGACEQAASEFLREGKCEVIYVGADESAHVSLKDAANKIVSDENHEAITLILGSLDFTENVKSALRSKMDKY